MQRAPKLFRICTTGTTTGNFLTYFNVYNVTLKNGNKHSLLFTKRSEVSVLGWLFGILSVPVYLTTTTNHPDHHPGFFYLNRNKMRFIHIVGHLLKGSYLGICASFINLFGQNLSPIQEYINPKLSQIHRVTKIDWRIPQKTIKHTHYWQSRT